MENEIDEYGSKYILTAIKTQVFSLHDGKYLRLFMKDTCIDH